MMYTKNAIASFFGALLLSLVAAFIVGIAAPATAAADHLPRRCTPIAVGTPGPGAPHALIFGQVTYRQGPLNNPGRDAELVAETLSCAFRRS